MGKHRKVRKWRAPSRETVRTLVALGCNLVIAIISKTF
jgi:hypothetical protein